MKQLTLLVPGDGVAVCNHALPLRRSSRQHTEVAREELLVLVPVEAVRSTETVGINRAATRRRLSEERKLSID